MVRDDYLARQRATPDYIDARAIAQAQLDLADALYRRREALGLSVADAAERAGLAPERLEMIEEGDASSLAEVLRLIQILDLELTLDRHLHVFATVLAGETTSGAIPSGSGG